jgi:prepilin-type N-terminal cleavage/methylation domain-containing protein
MRYWVSPRRGFTLVELLVGTAITALIVVMLGTMFASLTNTSLRTNQRIDAFRDARAALQMIERDLSGLVRNQRDATGTALTLPSAYFVLKDMYDDPAAGNQQMYALIAAKNSGSGDLCAVGYYCRWDAQRHAYSLNRFFTDSTATYSRLAGSVGYASDAVLYTPDPAATAPASVKDEVLASYVWNLHIDTYDAAGALLSAYPLVCDRSATSNDALPAAIEVSFRAISPNAARALISTNSQPDVWLTPTADAYRRLIAPHAYEFRTRIKL